MNRLIPLSIAVCLFVGSSTALAVNENTSIVLHARDGLAPCDDPQQQGVCIDAPPNMDLAGMQMPWVYVMLRNYDGVTGLQCAFDWPSSWMLLGGTYDCLPGSLVVHQPSSPGPLTGTMAVAFFCVQSGALITVGRMIFGSSAEVGCLSVIESGYAFRTHVVDCTFSNAAVLPENRGRVCVGAGGYDACFPASTPVESVTWGAIKGQYR